MTERAQELALEHEALLKQALSEPGVAVAMQVFESAKLSVATNQYAMSVSTMLMGTMPATRSV